MRKPIVIIGGMGPQASLRFHELLIEKSKKYHSGNGDEFPYIVHFSLPVEDFISDESKKDKAAVLLNGLTKVVGQLQPSVITLACNTAHILRPKVGFMQQPTFLSMLEAVAAGLKDQGIQQAGLLASPTTIRARLYQRVLSKRNIRTILPQSNQLPILEAAIRNVISGATDDHIQLKLADAASSLADKGAQAIVLGCTELPLIFDKKAVNVPVFDCLDIYANAVIDAHYFV